MPHMYANYTIQVWDIAGLSSGDPDLFRDGGRGEFFPRGDAFTIAAGSAPRTVVVSDNDRYFNDGDVSQSLNSPVTLDGQNYDSSDGRITPEYSYVVRPAGSTSPADDITIYVFEMEGNDTAGIASTRPLVPGMTYSVLSRSDATPSVEYSALAIYPDGIVEGTRGNDLINAGYAGDPEGDRIDNNDAILPGAAPNDDVVMAGAGDDTVYAGLGNDDVSGESGDDSLYGEAGDDLLDGGTGDDSLYGGDGNDTLRGAAGDDVLIGGEGDDLLEGGDGDDVLIGGDGNDTLQGGAGDDVLIGGAGDDLLQSGAGDDVLIGDEGNDSLEGGAGEDYLEGGAGNDLLMAGAGDDSVSGGAGADAIIGGAGADHLSGDEDRDTFTFGAGEGIGDVVDGGAGGDDHDVLDLTGSATDGGSLSIHVTGPDSNGNGQDGYVEYFDADGALTGRLDFTEIEEVVPCFTPGTAIATPQGERLVEELKPGDRIITRDNGIQQIRWIGRKALDHAQLSRASHMKPVLIRQGSLGNDLPERDMLVSPNHRMLVANDRTALHFDEHEVLVSAKHMVNGKGVQGVESPGVTYIHFMFDQHEVVLANGTWTESFQPGDYTLAGIGDAQRAEIHELFPELRSAEGLGEYAAARRTLKRHEAALLAR